MKTLLAISIATAYGLVIRLLFGMLPELMGIMSMTFMFLVPFIIGYLSVHFMGKKEKASKLKAFFIPWLSSLIILFITILLNMEGIICWLMIYPLFSIVAGLGGLYALFRFKKESKKDKDDTLLDDWEQPNSLKISLLFIIPLFIAGIEGDKALVEKEITITQSVNIAASKADIWHEIMHIDQVSLDEKKTTFSNFIGFPQHLYTTLDTAAVGGKRMAYYQNGLFFEETILEYVPEQKMVLDIFVDPKKVPPTVMDEHIVIGGKYVDLLGDEYLLKEQANGSSILTLSSSFKITTPFNWYAGIWSTILMRDLVKGELEMIKKRTLKKLEK